VGHKALSITEVIYGKLEWKMNINLLEPEF